MTESSRAASTNALAAAAAAATPSERRASVSTAIPPQLIAPFPKLESDHEIDHSVRSKTDDIGSATAAALSSAITNAHMPTIDDHHHAIALASQAVTASLSTAALPGAPVLASTVNQDESVLVSLQQSAHDQVMEIMNSYNSTNAHRRRSSVEAVAAASSVLASFANSSKSYMDSEVATAAAMAAAVNSTPQISQINSYTSQAAQHNAAAAALLAASGMHSVMLPTIPSVSTSLQGTPAPGERLSLSVSMEDDPLLTTTVAANATAALPASISMATTIPTSTAASGGDVSMQPFDMAAFGGLSPHSFAAANQITSSMAAATINIPTALQEQSEPIQATPKKKQPTPRRRKAAAGVSAATAAVAATAEETIDDYDLLSSDDEDGSPHAKDGMPLTPDAPGSGRPGSLRHLTADERRARRLQRNRLAAKECRQKKKAYIQNLEDQVHDLRKDNERLRKEIEELNAKLTLGGMRANSSATTPVLDTRQLLSAEYADSSMDSLSSPTLSSKRPRVAVRSTSNARLANGGD